MNNADKRFRELAAEQAGVVGRVAARAVGMTGHVLARRLRDDVIDAPTPRVLVLQGVPATIEQAMWIAITNVGNGAAVSHDTALARWGLPGFAIEPIHVTAGRNSSILAAPQSCVAGERRAGPLVDNPDHAIRLPLMSPHDTTRNQLV